TITEETYIYAVWEDITYTVSFNANGGTGSMLDETEQLGGYVLPECTFTAPTGKQFKCWAEGSASGQQYDDGDEYDVTADVTFYAVWENVPAQHVHDHGTTWKSDTNEHWNECACGDKANKAAHTDSTGDGKCDICEYQMSTTPNNPDDPNNTPDDPSDDKDGLGAGAIIAIVLGSLAILGGGFCFYWFIIRKRL
ncbi:MAG: InlB B-repeat-containing protein, partial [Clostridia bacterium]|nr:InlB B-repeat-containing protein [Clostridia bacterium]